MSNPLTPVPNTSGIKPIKRKGGIKAAKAELSTDVLSAIHSTTENMEKVLTEAVSKSHESRYPNSKVDIPKIAKLVLNRATGNSFGTLAAELGMDWPAFHSYLYNPIIKTLWIEAYECGEEFRKLQRIDVAHDHAVNGWDEPVYQQGQLVGHIRKFDHKLLMYLTTADEPSKFKPQPAAPIETQNNSFTIVFNTPISNAVDAAKVIDAQIVKNKDELPAEAKENWK